MMYMIPEHAAAWYDEHGSISEDAWNNLGEAKPPAGMAGIVAVKRPMKGWEWVTHNRLIDTAQSFKRERNELAGCDMMHVAPYGWVTGIMIENGMVRTTDRWTDGKKEGPTEG